MTDTMERPALRIISGPGSDDGPALVAAAIPVAPPKSWFDRTQLPKGSPLTFTADGQVYGRVAPRDIDHVGMPNQPTRAPYSKCNHAYFMTGQVRCDDGSTVNTGPITMLTGHPGQYAGSTAAAAHYDHTGTAVADVVVWDEPDGVYCAGAARPGVTPEQMRMAMGSTPSGDWRGIKADGFWGQEMCAALLVNRGGFPSRRDLALAASASFALVASGAPDTEDEPRSILLPDWDNPPRIVIAAATPEPETVPRPTDIAPTSPEDTVSTTPDTTPATTPDPVTAAAEPETPAITADQVVTVSGDLPPGLVASVDGDRALVQIEVPTSQLVDAGEQGRSLLASAQRDRLAAAENEKRDERMDKLTASVETLTASVEKVREERAADRRRDRFARALGPNAE